MPPDTILHFFTQPTVQVIQKVALLRASWSNHALLYALGRLQFPLALPMSLSISFGSSHNDTLLPFLLLMTSATIT